MKKIHVIAHTHWDYEWYFSRQEARVQFAYHMNEVLDALNKHQLEYYMLDGQMAIVDDYLQTNPDKREDIEAYNRAGRLMLGPWYTQVDEFTTTGESMVRNLRMGIDLATKLGGTMKIGYLPDSFGQSQDMPKIYNGFGIYNAVFWRGLPNEKQDREFKWQSNDGSEVYVINIQNGYYVGGELMDTDNYQQLVDKISKNSHHENLALPVGGDQRAVDYNLKDKIKEANNTITDVEFSESNYAQLFKEIQLETNGTDPIYYGEFVDPSVSKIHRGIYSSRYDLKQTYDQLERIITYQIEPLMAYAKGQGIPAQLGIVKELWKTVARGQAHDSAGGCNSDKTNNDILQRGMVALQTANALRDYLLKKISISDKKSADIYFYNPLPIKVNRTNEIEISTKMKHFLLVDENNNKVEYDILDQRVENAAALRRDKKKMDNKEYYITRIALKTSLKSMSRQRLWIKKARLPLVNQKTVDEIQNNRFKIAIRNGKLQLINLNNNKKFDNFLSFIDEGDEGDNYDYSPAYDDWQLNLDFNNAHINCFSGEVVSKMQITGSWLLPADLESRKNKKRDAELKYTIELTLNKDDEQIGFNMKVNNTIKDHRLRLIINADIPSKYSYADTQFGVIQRDVVDKHLANWKEIGYHEEPTALRPMLHFANLHDNHMSLTFLTHGMKSFEVIGKKFNLLAITLYRTVGYLGRPDMMRRPGDASGLECHETPTKNSQLQKKMFFEGSILLQKEFNPQEIQQNYLRSMTQNELYYQCQRINRYTTPIEYFPSNKLDLMDVQEEVHLKNSDCILSSFTLTVDGTGYELRIYNPNLTTEEGGSLEFKSPKTIARLDLNGKIQEILASNVKEYKIIPLNKGEIITLGIF